jgi:hypothetical protein
MKKITLLLFLSLWHFNIINGQVIKSKLLPSLDGTIKTKYEFAFDTGTSRFSVRNSRLGLSGEISEYLCYKTQIELSSNGKFEVLDLFATVKPFKGMKITLGQSSIPLFNSHQTSPSIMMFANRSFLAKYNTGSRDIGIHASYSATLIKIPVTFELGVYDGSTINTPVWTENVAYSGRISFGNMSGLRASAKVHSYPYNDQQNYLFAGADLRYSMERFRIQAEVMNRHNRYDGIDRFTSYIESEISIPLKNGKMFREIIPAVRWDGISENLASDGFDITRLTLGLSFGFTSKPFSSLLRMDYENYFVKRSLPEFLQCDENDSDKFTLELLIIF